MTILDKKTAVLAEPDRRQFLEKATGAVACVGIAAAAWPFISSMNPSADIVDKSTINVDISQIKSGESKTIEWQSKPIFILRRTDAQITAMQA